MARVYKHFNISVQFQFPSKIIHIDRCFQEKFNSFNL